MANLRSFVLCVLGLSQEACDGLVELGVRSVYDLNDLDGDDLAGLGLTASEKARLKVEAKKLIMKTVPPTLKRGGSFNGMRTSFHDAADLSARTLVAPAMGRSTIPSFGRSERFAHPDPLRGSIRHPSFSENKSGSKSPPKKS